MDNVVDLILVYFVAASILATTWAFLFYVQSWSAPATFFLIVWSAFIVVPIVFAPHFYLNAAAMFWLLGMAIAWATGAAIGYRTPLGHFRSVGSISLAKRFSTRGTAISVILSSLVASGVIVMEMQQISTAKIGLSLIRNVEQIARNNATDRYQGSLNASLFTNLLVASGYFSALLGGLYAAAISREGTKTRSRILISLLPILVITVFGVLQNTKASTLYATVMWVSGFLLVHSGQKARLSSLLKPKTFLIGAGVFALLLALFYWMQSTRYSSRELTIKDSYDLLMVYAVGHLGGFSYWFDHYYISSNYGLGANSFSGLYESLGLIEKTESPAQLPKPLWGELETNVDTAFSELIMDFGIFGSLVVVFTFAAIVTIAHRLFVRGIVYLAPMISAFYAVTLWSFTTNLFNYLTIIVALVLFSIYLALARVRWRR